MFYEPDKGHDLPHNPFGALVSPRPIGWVSSQNRAGQVNLAPFSFFNAAAYDPPQVMFSITEDPREREQTGDGVKDTLRNIRETKEFVVNMATYSLRKAVNLTSVNAPPDLDEFDYASLNKRRSCIVKPPSVRESPVNMECRLTHIQKLPSAKKDKANYVVFGVVVGIYIEDSFIKDGIVDIEALAPISRLGYKDFATLGPLFQLDRPV